MTFPRLILGVCAILWLVAVGGGIRILWRYEFTPGNRGSSPVLWPSETSLQRGLQGATLVMALHPHCPCSRASLSELAELVARSQSRVSAYVLFYQPAGWAETWAKTELWEIASAIPGVTRMIDWDGQEARRFGGVTSGQTSLYDDTGRLLFTGGITLSRGHAGNNPGRSAIVSWVNQKASEISETPVFGCPLFDARSGINRSSCLCKPPG